MRIDDVNVIWIPGDTDHPGWVEVRNKSCRDPVPAGANMLPVDDALETPTGGHRERQFLSLFITYNVIVRDGVPPAAVHDAFMAIDEYAETVAPGVHGAVAFTPRQPVIR